MEMLVLVPRGLIRLDSHDKGAEPLPPVNAALAPAFKLGCCDVCVCMCVILCLRSTESFVSTPQSKSKTLAAKYRPV